MAQTEEWKVFLVSKVCTLFSPGPNGFTFLAISHFMLKSIFFLNFRACSLSVVEVLLCSNLKDDSCKLNLVLNLFSFSPKYVRNCFCYCCFIRNTFSKALAVKWVRGCFFCRQLHSLLS